jgi:hypothetical protein
MKTISLRFAIAEFIEAYDIRDFWLVQIEIDHQRFNALITKNRRHKGTRKGNLFAFFVIFGALCPGG